MSFSLNLLFPISDFFFQELHAGRTFDEDEDESKPLVAVVSESIARAIAGTPSKALGRRFTLGNRGNGDWTIVGIVADARYRS